MMQDMPALILFVEFYLGQEEEVINVRFLAQKEHYNKYLSSTNLAPSHPQGLNLAVAIVPTRANSYQLAGKHAV